MSDASRLEVKCLIADQVSTAASHLLKHLRGRLRNPRVLVRKDGVGIRGRTKAYYVKQLAQHAVKQHVSLPIAANEIVVDY